MSELPRQPYFAYALNMEQAQMRARCASAILIGVARLANYRFMINMHRLATVIPDTKSEVYGLLWSLTQSDVQILDIYEQVDEGLYTKDAVDVELSRGPSARALIYLATDSVPYTPQSIDANEVADAAEHYGQDYISKVIAAAEQAQLPTLYIEVIETFQN